MAVSVSRADGVATVMVDNPPVNALDDETLIGLRDAAESLIADREVRVVVVAGAGERAFMAGADLRTLGHALGRDGVPGEMERHVSLTGPMFAAWMALPQPTVAAVTANAIGGGLEFALCCEFLVADPRARFGLPEVTLGLMPGGGGTQRLPRRIGLTAATELILTGRLIDSDRALELGLINSVSEPGGALAASQELARGLAALPAVAAQSAKRALRSASEDRLAAGLATERRLFLNVAASRDAREGADAFLGKRPPAFRHG